MFESVFCVNPFYKFSKLKPVETQDENENEKTEVQEPLPDALVEQKENIEQANENQNNEEQQDDANQNNEASNNQNDSNTTNNDEVDKQVDESETFVTGTNVADANQEAEQDQQEGQENNQQQEEQQQEGQEENQQQESEQVGHEQGKHSG